MSITRVLVLGLPADRKPKNQMSFFSELSNHADSHENNDDGIASATQSDVLTVQSVKSSLEPYKNVIVLGDRYEDAVLNSEVYKYLTCQLELADVLVMDVTQPTLETGYALALAKEKWSIPVHLLAWESQQHNLEPLIVGCVQSDQASVYL